MQSMSLNACVEIYVTQVLVEARSRIGMLVNFTSAGNRETNEIATHFRSKPFSTNNFDSRVHEFSRRARASDTSETNCAVRLLLVCRRWGSLSVPSKAMS